MGLPASIWFIIAVVALLLGALLLLVDRMRISGTTRDRRRWAGVHGWEYLDQDPVLPSRWRYGTISQGGPGVARSLVSGWSPSDGGRRRIYVFDHDQGGRIRSVLVAVETTAHLPAAIELRRPTAAPQPKGMEALGPVGRRIAFVSESEAAKPLATTRLAAATDAVGDDIELVWAEDSWVLAAAPPGIDLDRVEDLLDDLVGVATALEQGPGNSAAGTPAASAPAGGAPPPSPTPRRANHDDWDFEPREP